MYRLTVCLFLSALIFSGESAIPPKKQCPKEDAHFSYIFHKDDGEQPKATAGVLTNWLAVTANSCFKAVNDTNIKNYVFQGWDEDGDTEHRERVGISNGFTSTEYKDDNTNDLALVEWDNVMKFVFTPNGLKELWSKDGIQANVGSLKFNKRLKLAWYEYVSPRQIVLHKVPVKFTCQDEQDYLDNEKYCLKPVDENIAKFTPACGAILYTYDEGNEITPCFTIYGVTGRKAQKQKRAETFLLSQMKEWILDSVKLSGPIRDKKPELPKNVESIFN